MNVSTSDINLTFLLITSKTRMASNLLPCGFCYAGSQLLLADHMNGLKAQAEEVVVREIVYQ